MKVSLRNFCYLVATSFVVCMAIKFVPQLEAIKMLYDIVKIKPDRVDRAHNTKLFFKKGAVNCFCRHKQNFKSSR